MITIGELRDRTPELRRQEQALDRELQSAVDRAKDRETYLRLAETLTGFLARLHSSAETLDIAERQRIVRLIVKEVLVTENKITIRHSIPISGSPGGGPDPSKPGNHSTEGEGYLLGFKDVTAPTNVRSMIAALIPGSGVGNTLPIISIDGRAAADAALLLANFEAIPFDYVARQKIQGQHPNWFIVEQLPVVPLETHETLRFGLRTAGEIVREAVLDPRAGGPRRPRRRHRASPGAPADCRTAAR